ncbi:hypothetical protein G7046_g4825 [Stylonectria norvegica]|nr:hypothetical protein G7046_g4825 [Stylonectria norvegica]
MSNQTVQANRKRVVHQLDTPYSTVAWPEISSEDQDTILELLCDLLSPLGKHRQTYVKPSKGKRAARREREARKGQDAVTENPVPPKPELGAKVDVGLNAISRTLQSLSSGANKDAGEAPSREYSMVFVARGNQASSFNCHFPQMVGIASRDLAPDNKIRLVGISKPCSDRLSDCLGLPRVSSVAVLRDAAGAEALQHFVRKTVTPVEVNWLDAAGGTPYLATKINAVETKIGSKRMKVE